MIERIDLTFILHVISFFCWTIVYLDAIRIGFRDKTYCIPFIGLALNLPWEAMSLLMEFAEAGVLNFSCAVWLFLDVFIMITYFKYGKKHFPKNVNIKWFFPWSILAIIVFFLIHYLFNEHFGLIKGRLYSSFIQNLVMSGLFLQMLQVRNSGEGQSLAIAVNKLIGTLMPTITFGIIGSKVFNGPNLLLLGLGAGCFIFDSLYVFFLFKVKRNKLLGTEGKYLF
jgi:hypothetical protein